LPGSPPPQSRIIEHLSKLHGVTLDASLSPAQRATARAVRRMLAEGLYFTGIYARWVDDEGWPHTRAAMATFIPRFAVLFLPLIRRSVTSVDATLYAFEEAVLVHPAASPVKAHVQALPNLVAHRDRMRAFFPPERRASRR